MPRLAKKTGTKWIINSTAEYIFLSPSSTIAEIPQTGWKVRKVAEWEDDNTLTVKEMRCSVIFHCTKIYFINGTGGVVPRN